MYSKVAIPFVLFLLVLPPCGSASETLACRQLAELVSQPQTDLSQARALQTAAGSEPQLKCVSSAALSLLCIRKNDFSMAWKELNATSAALNAASPAVRLEHDKIKLWLLIEARSPKADEHLKRLVTQVVQAETKENDRQDMCSFLGKLLRLLDGCQNPPGVTAETVDRARQILTTQKSTESVKVFENGWSEIDEWERAFQLQLSRCSSQATAQAVLDELMKTTEQLDKDMKAASADLQAQDQAGKQLDQERDAARREVNQVRAEMKKTTPGKPSLPRAPSEPSRPSSRASQAEQDRYDREMRNYRSSLRRHDQEMDDYAARLAQWQALDAQRRTTLNQMKAKLDPLLAAKETELQNQKVAEKSLAERVRSLKNDLQRTQSQIEIIRSVSRAGNLPPKPEATQKPSLYPILDYAKESIRLSKMVTK